MSNILLRPNERGDTDLSHFHGLVSAYHTTKESVECLEEQLLEAVEKAKKEAKTIIVEQDCLRHIFVVFPSGIVSLYREVGNYQIVKRS